MADTEHFQSGAENNYEIDYRVLREKAGANNVNRARKIEAKLIRKIDEVHTPEQRSWRIFALSNFRRDINRIVSDLVVTKGEIENTEITALLKRFSVEVGVMLPAPGALLAAEKRRRTSRRPYTRRTW